MADPGVAFDTRNVLARVAGGIDTARQIRVAFQTCSIGHPVVAGRDLDSVRESLCRERPGMEEPIQCFCRVLGKESGWSVAIVADRPLAVARPQPPVILLVHHMTVGASAGVVGEIGTTLRIAEGENANSQKYTTQYAQQQPGRCTASLCFQTHHSIISHPGRHDSDGSHREGMIQIHRRFARQQTA